MTPYPPLSAPYPAGPVRVPLRFVLEVDAQRRWPRGSLPWGSQRWEGAVELRGGRRCLNQSLHIAVRGGHSALLGGIGPYWGAYWGYGAVLGGPDPHLGGTDPTYGALTPT